MKKRKNIYKKKKSQKFLLFQDFPTATATAHATRAPHPRRRCVYSDEDIVCNLFPDLLEFTSLADDAGDVGVEGGSLATPAVESVKNKMKYEQKQRERDRGKTVRKLQKDEKIPIQGGENSSCVYCVLLILSPKI